MPSGLQTVMRARGPVPAAVPAMPGLVMFCMASDGIVVGNRTGSPPSAMDLTKSGANMILTHGPGGFTADDIHSLVRVTDSAIPANNGYFRTISQGGGGTTLTYINTAGVTEAGFTGTWELLGKVSQITDRVAGRVFTQATSAKRWCVYPGSQMSPVNSGRGMGRYGVEANLSCVDASLAGLFNGNTTISVACFTGLAGVVAGTGSAGGDLLGVENAALSHYHRVRLTGSTNSWMVTRSASSSISPSFNWGYTGELSTLGWTMTGGATHEFSGAAYPVGPSFVPGTGGSAIRTLAGLTTTTIGSVSALQPSYACAWALGTAAWTAADYLTFENFVRPFYV